MREKITQSIIMVSLMLGLASVPSAALAVYFDDRISACQPFKKIAIPKADLPTEADRKRLKSSGSACFELTEDSVTERLCAYLDREGDDPDDNDLFSGSGMLLMIYANGRGVQRNISLAKRFACEIRGMDEHVIEARFSHLDEIAQDPSRSPVFEACDGIVRSDMDGLCAAYSTDDVRIKRDQQLTMQREDPAGLEVGEVLEARAGRGRASRGGCGTQRINFGFETMHAGAAYAKSCGSIVWCARSLHTAIRPATTTGKHRWIRAAVNRRPACAFSAHLSGASRRRWPRA